MKKVFPDLRSYKRQRAELILKKYLKLTPRNGKYTKDMLNMKKRFEREVLEIKANG